jgi:alkylmercury lyase
VSLEDLTEALANATPSLDPAGEKVALATYRLLAEGSPVTPEAVAEAAGVSREDVARLWDLRPGVFRDSEGRVLGFWGLTIARLEPTHRLQVDDRTLYAWCAWDTLFLPGILQTTTQVTSTCPTTGETIELVVGPDGISQRSHPEAVVSFLLPARPFDADVIQGFCHFVHFFADRAPGERWIAEHPGTFLLTLEEAFDLGARLNRRRYPNELRGGR